MVHVRELQRKTARYELADGLHDFHHAFWLLVTGFYAWLVWDSPTLWQPFAEYARSQGIIFIILIAFVLPIGVPLILSQFGLRTANEYLRRRWLWRSTGFVKSKAWVIPRSVLFMGYAVSLLCFSAGILLAAHFRVFSFMLYGLYVGIGLAFAVIYLTMSIRVGVPRYRITALVGTLGTVVLVLLPLRAGQFPLAISLFWAVLLIVSGFSALLSTARKQREADDAA